MSDLTIQDLKDKLSMIDKDIEKLRGEAGNDRKLAVLNDYRDYIKDEIKFLENESKQK